MPVCRRSAAFDSMSSTLNLADSAAKSSTLLTAVLSELLAEPVVNVGMTMSTSN